MSNNMSIWMQSLTSAYPKFEAINPEKAKSELGFAMQLFQNSSELQKCDPQSILNAVVNVARTSITLNPVMRLAYLVPRNKKCVLEFSYMGLVALLRDNGCIKSISAHIVYADEEFEYDVAENKIYHKPTFAKTEAEHNKREIIGCYSRATLPNGENVFEFMPMWEIEKVKRNSLGSDSKYSAWQTWRDEMIKKSVIKRHFKMLISGNPSEALTTAISIEQENNPLANSFDKKPSKKSILTAFDDVQEQSTPTEQIEFITEPNSSVNTDTMSDDEIELLMQQESAKMSDDVVPPPNPSDLFGTEEYDNY
jgi:phage RecT family recombinase